LNVIINLPSNTAIYLVPFFERDFNCAYFIKSFNTDEKLKDNNLSELSVKEQVQAFIYFAKMAGHPVITDFIMKFARYAYPVIENPYLARWIDTKYAQKMFANIFDDAVLEMEKSFDKDDIEIIKGIYKQESKGNLSEEYEKIYTAFEDMICEKKQQIVKDMYKSENQIKLQKRVIGKSIKELMKEGLWTVPCGADSEYTLPVFNYMNEEENYPVFKHYDEDGVDISEDVRHDFQTPAYFKDLNSEKINTNVLKYFINLWKNLVEDYNFDGFKICDIENIFGNSKNDKIPEDFLKSLISKCKQKNFALLADSRFEKRYFKNYQNLGIDILFDSYENLTPEKMLMKYAQISNYNLEDFKRENLSFVQIYNNKFGEVSYINKYPAQLGREGALFKWFCMHFLPAGKNVKLPIVYLDGDEFFTKKGFAKTLYEHSKLNKNSDISFYKNFRAIKDFANSSAVIKDGEATVIEEYDDGFVSWMISKEPLKESFLVVANYKPKEENIILKNENDKIKTSKENNPIVNKMVTIPGEYTITKEYVFDGENYIEKEYTNNSDLLEIEILNPCEYRIFGLRK